MKSLARAIVSVLAFAGVYLISYWLFFVQVLPDSIAWAQTGGALLLAMTVGWLIWFQMGKSSRGVMGTALVWAAVAGAIGFAGRLLRPDDLRARRQSGADARSFHHRPSRFHRRRDLRRDLCVVA